MKQIMRNFNAILRNQQNETLQLCQEISDEIGINLTTASSMAEFLLRLQENDLHVAIFECNHFSMETFGWLKLIRKMRPKIPLIFVCHELERETEAQMYEIGIFYVGVRPVHRVLLSEVFLAAIKSYLAQS